MRNSKNEVDSSWQSSARGEKAWKEVTDEVASRNADTRKAGRSEREEYERGREQERRGADAKRDAKLIKPKP
ncbi:MAG TPA: hypothetical protein VJT68_09590 [Thermoleophilaceae bacterium]|nr:hypothetical protein [Thermoleophilaceae bacterium]